MPREGGGLKQALKDALAKPGAALKAAVRGPGGAAAPAPTSAVTRPATVPGEPTVPACSAAPFVPYAFAVPAVALDISFRPGRTLVTSVVDYVPQPGGDCAALQLRGQGLELLELQLDGEPVPPEQYTVDEDECTLTLRGVPQRPFQLRCVTALAPEQDTELEGLFCVGGVYVTQCEATQFSMLTFFPDRPDVLSRWRVRLEGDEAQLPVLISNGRVTDAGRLPGGRHYALWEDPLPKPCYLFSAIAGRLALREDTHTTPSGRCVALKIYVPEAYSGQLDVAMTAIKAAMVWDEASFGREYGLDTYTMVGLEGFNDDAAESSGLALFCISVLAASPAANTDEEVLKVRRLVAHEYFHTLSGNRVTLRDWLQLTVKEGLTVYREHTFLEDFDAAAAAVAAQAVQQDQGQANGAAAACAAGAAPPPRGFASHAAWEAALLAALRAHAVHASGGPDAAPDAPQPSSWRRVAEAEYLRSEQFGEDDGPLAHAIRPHQVSSVCNLYTDTVYSKGAAVVRMFRNLLGPSGFRRGVEAFFDTYDGMAVPCEAFPDALAAANPGAAALVDGMRPWYDTPGTPLLCVSASYSPSSQSLTLTVRQSNETAQEAAQEGCAPPYAPQLIPLKVGLVGPDGRDLPLHLKAPDSSGSGSTSGGKRGKGGKGSKGGAAAATAGTCTPEGVVTHTGLQGRASTSVVLLVDGWTKSFTFTRVPDKPLVSLLRDFSAPVRMEVEGETDKSLGFLAQHDSNPFARWDACQRLLTRLLVRLYDKAEEAEVDSDEELAALLSKAFGGPPPALLAALQATLAARDLDEEFQASMLQLPCVDELVSELDEPDPVLLWMVKVHVGTQLARALRPQLEAAITRCDARLAELGSGFEPAVVKVRALKNTALGLLSYDWSEAHQQQLLQRYYGASCMTDRLAALELLADEDSPARAAALAHFHDTYRDQPLAMHKWLYVQAACDLEDNTPRVAALMQHPAFSITSPPACEHLLFGFASSVLNFHAEDGSGYVFMADAVLKVDGVNPQMAARLAATLVDWEAFDEDRQALMLAQLRRIAALGDEHVSDNLLEVVQAALPDGDSDSDDAPPKAT